LRVETYKLQFDIWRNIGDEVMLDFINITKALSDENRIRVLMMLTKGELCVCQLIELLGLAPSTVSKHMFILRQARLVETRKQGRWRYYRLPDKDVSTQAKQAIDWAVHCLAKDRQIIADRRQLKNICKIDKVELCKKYKT
jgi:DNA-binding transcriptional ArsR family regulator